MKRILIFSLIYYPRFIGGAEIAIKEITNRIAPSDIEFHMITLRLDSALPKEEKIGNVIVHRVGFGKRNLTYVQSFSMLVYIAKIFFIPLATISALRLHHIYRFDAFWAMMSYMLIPIVLIRFLGVRVPYLLTLQEGDTFNHVFNRPHIRLFRPILSVGFRHASAVQTISTFLSGWAKRAGFLGEPIVIPNAVDIANFSQIFSTESHIDTRTSFRVTSDDILLVTTSRLVHKNAVDDVIRALALLPKNVHFIVYGIGPDEVSLKDLAQTKGVKTRVHFMGQITHENLPRVLNACDIFIRPSRSEGMGNSFIEAMATGLPVIATQEGGIIDFLFDAKRNPNKDTTGWAVDKNAPEQIATVAQNIIAQPAQAKLICATAKKLVIKEYNWDDISMRMLTLFNQVIATHQYE